jgi:hypothetical protein
MSVNKKVTVPVGRVIVTSKTVFDYYDRKALKIKAPKNFPRGFYMQFIFTSPYGAAMCAGGGHCHEMTLQKLNLE